MNHVKIGYTKNSPADRARELSGETGVTEPYRVSYALLCHEALAVEQTTHRRLTQQRVNPNREFFTISVQQAVVVIESVAGARSLEVGKWQGDWSREAIETRQKQQSEASQRQSALEAQRREQEAQRIEQEQQAHKRQERERAADEKRRQSVDILLNNELANVHYEFWRLKGPIKLTDLQVYLSVFSLLTLLPIFIIWNLKLNYPPHRKQRQAELERIIKAAELKYGVRWSGRTNKPEGLA